MNEVVVLVSVVVVSVPWLLRVSGQARCWGCW